MNRRIISNLMICLLAMNASTFASHHSWLEKKSVHKDLNVKSFSVSYIVSLLLSGGVGIATGGFTAYFENVIVKYMKKSLPQEVAPLVWFLPFFTWIIESEIRNDIITGLQTDLDAYQIHYKKGLMLKNAALASWISYLRNSFIFG